MPVKKWWASTLGKDPANLDVRLSVSARKGETTPGWVETAWEGVQPMTVKPGDWLSKGEAGEKDRKGQTLQEFLRPGPHRNFPSKMRMTIYLIPIGDVSAAPAFSQLATCVSAHFGMAVKQGRPLKSKELKQVEVNEDGAGYGPQFEAPSASEVLFNTRKERDAFVTVGYTMSDLCDSTKGFNFLFGQADLDKNVGVFSFARYMDDAPAPSIFLRRCCMVLCHEIGHLFGMKHCVWGLCLMNGSNHLEESERRPFSLCPCDILKLEDAHRPVGGLDLLQREQRLLEFYEASGLTQDADVARIRVQIMSGVCTPCSAPSKE